VISRPARSLTCAALLAAFGAQPAAAETFRWASGTDPQTLDPHAVSSAPVLGFLNNVYEGLVRRDKAMRIEPALATAWEPLQGDESGWRFTLREGVTYQDGSAFTADDVLFSYERAASEASDVRSWFAPVTEVRVIDDVTVDFVTAAPNPLFPGSIANFMIMDRDWTTDNDAALPSSEAENHATRNANGTGAFRVTSRDPGVRTTLAPFEDWWDTSESDITEAVFTPIGEAATGVAALLSGEIDYLTPVPLQDLPRLRGQSGITVHEGIEARVIMFGFNHAADALFGGDGTEVAEGAEGGGGNPFADVRVREAAYRAIDVNALTSKIMRGTAQPVGQLVSDTMSGYSEAQAGRFGRDQERAKQLLAEAGHPDGFGFSLRCTNDRYINDEAICKAAASMLTRVGLRAELESMPVRTYWPELREGKFDMFLLGWSPGTFDIEHPIRFLLATPNEESKLGSWNFGGYSNARLDELLPMIQTELDEGRRQAMIDEVVKLTQDEIAYIPLYVQPLVGASQASVTLTQRADDFFILRWVNVGG